jgi:copper resistance protein B
MKTNRHMTSTTIRRSTLLTTLLLTIPFTAWAQDTNGSADAPKTPMHDMSGMDHSGMQGMTMPSDAKPTSPSKKSKKKAATPKPPADAKASDDRQGMDHSSMPGMDKDAPKEPNAVPGMDHGEMPTMNPEAMPAMGAMPGMAMESMQGGKAPPNARSPDYSDGATYGPMKGMDMADNAPMGILLIDQLEALHGSDANGQTWEAEGWYGNDVDKLWLRTEGERSGGKLEDADLEAFWNRNIATFWSTQVGVRHDFGEGPSRTWAAVGMQGLSPYWFELEATAYVGQSGRTAARLRAEYELLLTQRLVLQPEAEVNLYGKDDPARRIGSGLSDVQFGLRLRYEVSRQFAPYIGVNFIRRVGTTADFAREDFQPVFDRQIVAGVRLWF